MELIADILLVAGALGAGVYCFVLARRLKRFTDLEKGVGGAVSVLSAQADELKASLDAARMASDQSGKTLEDLTQRAESVAQRLELMMASMHDVIPQEEPQGTNATEPPSDADEPVEDAEAQSTEPVLPKTVEHPEPETSGEAIKPTKVPEGIMFFRHGRAVGGAQ
ncbi:hypothetical protein [Ruegeria sp.]|uniref:hypothetical protein n=1 Tax=Ruegeria sp. TaxID=1879320 RepID=UPI003C7D1D44